MSNVNFEGNIGVTNGKELAIKSVLLLYSFYFLLNYDGWVIHLIQR